MIKSINLNWFKIAKDCIDQWFECPICNYKDTERELVEHHIEHKHTMQEIKEICT